MIFALRGKELFRIEAGELVIAADCTREELVEAVLAATIAHPDADRAGLEAIRRFYTAFEWRLGSDREFLGGPDW